MLQTVSQIKLNTSNESYPHECSFIHIQVKFMFFSVTTSLHDEKIIEEGNKVLVNISELFTTFSRRLSGEKFPETVWNERQLKSLRDELHCVAIKNV
jgi:hypothetical protein